MEKDTKLDTKNKDIKKKYPIDKNQKIKKFSYISYINPISKPGKRFGEFMKQKKNKRRIFMVLMQTRNGKYNLFTVATTAQSFKYDNGVYYIDPDMVRENVFSKMNMLFYHQDCSIPFKIDFNMNELRKSLGEAGTDVEKAINPLSLKSWINAQVIEKVLKGAEMTKELNMIKLIVIINTVATVALALVIAKLAGII